MALSEFEQSQRDWLVQEFEALTTRLIIETPSQWAQRKRYLPPSVTSLPGYFRFEVAPYTREILDCLGPESPVREVSWMKGVQITATTAVLENAIGYFADSVKSAPVMMVTADAELAKLRMESHITPMLQLSGLEHLIKSTDEKNTRKTGKTDKKIEWVGGGYLIPFGAQNANKLRSIPIQILLRDEIDGWPDVVGKDGDPIKLSADRTAAYEASRKILDISTPLIKGQSKIERRFLQGDRRRYFVCCLKCGFSQTLRFRRTNKETGEISGIVWDTENGILVPDSVRYLCRNCGHAHFNDDKTRLLSPAHGAEWRPTAVPTSPHHRSYHLSALYSPVGMQTWAACVLKWLDAWDTERDTEKDFGHLQVFYNNVLGEPFEISGDKVRFESVSEHRRAEYLFGQVPNSYSVKACGSPASLLTCAVDVHKDNLSVGVFAWVRGRRVFLVDYEKFEGDITNLEDAGSWGRLRDLIEQREYAADDGKKYRPALTLIDSGYETEKVYSFCAEYQGAVHPSKGRAVPPKGAALREFSEFDPPVGRKGYLITVDFYKDRWAAALQRPWNRLNLQPQGQFNAPSDITDKQLDELTAETKHKRTEGGRVVGFEWRRPSGARNELWDCLIYANAAHDILAWKICKEHLQLPTVDWPLFYDLCEQRQLFFTE